MVVGKVVGKVRRGIRTHFPLLLMAGQSLLIGRKAYG